MITYIIKSSLSLLLLFGLYWFLLRKEKLFVFNRIFLVSSVVFSLIVPFISIPVNFLAAHQLEEIIPTYNYIIPEIRTSEIIIRQDVNISQTSAKVQSSGIDISKILGILYFSGVLLFLIRFLRNTFLILSRIKVSEKISFEGYRIVLTNDNMNPYCFFRSIFLNRDDYMNGRIDKDLLNHELEHVRQYHSIDIVFIELIKIFYWFNPVYLLYDRAIRINHEYLADHGVIRDDVDIKSYMGKLLGFIIGRTKIPLTSGSDHSFTKNRLIMMTKSKSKNTIYGFRISSTLFLILVFSFLLSFKQSNLQSSDKEAASGGLFDLQKQTVKDVDGNIYKTVTINNNFWMAENLRTTKYNDGTDILKVTDDRNWQKYGPAFCWYNNNEAENKYKYGALYNWYAVNTDKLCPVGWHVPSSEELVSLNIFSPLDTSNGGGLKETGTDYWYIPNRGATNEKGFTARPGGLRNYNGEFILLGEQGTWWTSDEENNYIGFCWILTYNESRVQPHWPSKRDGLSVRCIMDYSQRTSNSSINSGEMAQNIIRGIVTTEDGKPLFGATISSTGTNNPSSETIADADGRFTINDIKSGTSLLIECRGFKSQTHKADFASEMVIKLVRDPDFKVNQTNILDLQEVSFRNSDFMPTKAFVVIDGVKIDYKGALMVNPTEIESFKVLKDKEAIKKYGNNGKDGVAEIILYGNKTGYEKKKPSDRTAYDTSKYITGLSINHLDHKGKLIDIPVSNLKSISVWTYRRTPKNIKKEFRTISIMTRDYYKVKGRVVSENGKPLSGVKISQSENPVTETSDNEGRFVFMDVRENALLEFSYPGFEPYYINTSFVPFTMELTIELKKDEEYREEAIIGDSATLPNNTKPLVIVDDLESKLGMDMILPSEISSVTVLKDASATAAFGTKGANGVIIVTKKKKASESAENRSTETSISTLQKKENTAKSEKQDKSGDAVVEVTNMNVLYLGVSNPIEIAVPGVPSDKVTATITNGTINRTVTGWEVKPVSFGESVITVLVNNTKVTEKKFRIKPIPAPVAVFAGKSMGSVTRNQALEAGVLEAELKDFLWDLKFEIESFTFMISKDNGDTVTIPATGNKLTDEMISLMSDFKRGESVIFKDIKAKGPDGGIKELNPLILKIGF
jgi:uncharacterized protein (TIGR02145 family)